MDIVVAGEDPVAVDCVGSAIIGRGPDEAKYLKFSEKKGLGTAKIEEIEIIGATIEDVCKNFQNA